MEVDCLEESEIEEARTFLQEVFGVIPSRLLSTELWRWKCLEPHPLWPGSRGFIRRNKGRVAAYAALIPLRFLTPQGEVSCCHVIDWAASRAVPGAGIRIYKHLQSLGGCAISIGGAADTRTLLPRIGATVREQTTGYRRPARPFRAAVQGRKDWKTPARLIRDYSYALAPLPSPPDDVTVVPVERFDARVEPCLPVATPGVILPVRSVDLLNYWLRCPAAEMHGYLLQQRNDTIGYFLLSIVPPTALIADLWVHPYRPEAWPWAYGAAFQHAARTGMLTVETMSSHPEARRVLDQIRLRKGHNQVFLLDPDRTIPPDLPLALSAVDFDGFYT